MRADLERILSRKKEFIEISEIVIDIYNINSEIIFSYNNDSV